ncbi:mechanosensitive ion channel family protein [Microbulbifer flavimaris]|uniref:Small-conductance mechanosensitive channel n=1 Tax=Microbulbifer flavimaris TaxID=1781068 RepID=A0ABX4I4N7_9GAMM|nr:MULTISPECIES: mechanosensitive ion channel family protein [Microbulbifer]KUJ84650.1 mechanosensitive ion channel protein MscS [Microbulbifer sp. ZGT114]PCO06738.1 mechanosensitive ion channel family protein [Microbulbifer flavimaris]
MNSDNAEAQAGGWQAILPERLQPIADLLQQYPLLGAAAILLITLIIALICRFVVFRQLRRWLPSDRTGPGATLLVQLQRPVFTTILCLGLIAAHKLLTADGGVGVVSSLLSTVILVSWIRMLFLQCGTLLQVISKKSARFSLIDQRAIPLLDLSCKLLVILFGSYALLLIWGINPLGWLASAGVIGIAVGFAAKDTLANLFSGFFILADAPYKVGDYVNLDSGERGRVTQIGLRSTRLMTRDDVEITLPNSLIANGKIINESGGPSAAIRVTIPVGVAYGSDVDEVCDILLNVALEHTELVASPEPRVRMRGFGASSLDFELLVWIELPEDRGRIRHELLLAIYKSLAAHRVEIPYAKSDVYIKELPSLQAGRTEPQ